MKKEKTASGPMLKLIEDQLSKTGHLDKHTAEQLLAEVSRLRREQSLLRRWKGEADRYRKLHKHAASALYQVALRSAQLTRALKEATAKNESRRLRNPGGIVLRKAPAALSLNKFGFEEFEPKL